MKERIEYLLEKESIPNVNILEEIRHLFNNYINLVIEEIEGTQDIEEWKNLEKMLIHSIKTFSDVAHHKFRTKEEREDDVKNSLLDCIFKLIKWDNFKDADEGVEYFNNKYNSNLKYYEGMNVEEFANEVKEWKASSNETKE